MQTIVGVGGTGQMVLHYYLQLFLIGRVERFRAVVIDTDGIMPSLQAVSDFVGLLQYGNQSTAGLGVDLPEIHPKRFAPPSGNSVRKLLTGSESDEKVHAASAFFSSDALGQSVQKGLFARPALSSTLSRAVLEDPALAPGSTSETVVLVGSVIGGTGGGLIAPVIDAVREQGDRVNRATKLRGVFFAEYFVPDASRVDGGAQRFQSNQALTLRSLEDASTELHSFYVVGGPGTPLIQRKPDVEQKAVNLLWPKEHEPYFEGVKALAHMLQDSVGDASSRFEDREVTLAQLPGSLTQSTLMSSIQDAVERASQLVDRRVVVLASHEPFVKTVWGDGLPEVLVHFWRKARDLGDRRASENFPERVQEELETLWHGRGDYGLKHLFPISSQGRPSGLLPIDFAKVRWPRPSGGDPEPALFHGEEQAARRCAANLLLAALRG